MSTIPLSQVILEDRWPGNPSVFVGRPTGGWANTNDNFTTTATTDVPKYPLGTKVSAYTDNTWCAGWYTMIYMSFHDYSAVDISGDFSDGQFWCSHYDGSDAQLYQDDISVCPYYVVSRCYTAANTDVTRGAPVAVPCYSLASDGSGAFVAGYGDAYGWFWVGGVCPVADVTLMKGDADNIAGADVSFNATLRGPIYADMSGSSFVGRSGDEKIFTIAQQHPPIGWTCTSAV